MNQTIENQSSTSMKWYIVRAQANRERSVSERITKEAEKGDLMGKVGKVIVPMEKSFFLKNGKKVTREKVMYPGYIFVETNAIGELKYYLKGCNGATGFLTNRSGEIQPLKNEEVERMIGQHEEIVQKQLESPFVISEEVKVIDGPFKGFIGSIKDIKEQKVKVGVLIFGRETIVELNTMQIDKK